MAKRIDDETMENVCILAKLSLKGGELDRAREEMQKMLDYVQKLEELDTENVPPLTHIFGDADVFREDIVRNSDTRDVILANAPKVKEGQFQVPKTVG
ncbi:Asp-tRNA(Asn)/Glu-tRNA(Gln) amidotransferase subunit GatC [Blautia schinkii]|nr:Asp-tRNA(Asn)/Glu-tRNA(Gln) amidotransferase subunit GatC [Blautia schinkii]